MIRKIITPQERTYVLELPEDFIGKEIEVLAFEVEEDATKPGNGLVNQSVGSEDRLRQIENRFSKYQIDMSGYQFDRDEANNYE